MGGKQSSSLKTVTDIVNKNVRNIVSTKISQTNVDISLTSEQIVSLNMVECGGDLNITSDAAISLTLMNEFTDQDTTELKSLISNDIESQMESLNDISVELGAIAYTDQSTKQEIYNRITNIMETNVTKENLNAISVTTSVQVTQDIVLNSVKVTGNCNITNNALIDANIVNVTNFITNLIMEDEQINTVLNEQASKQRAELTGLATLVESLGSLLSGPFLIFIIIAFVLVILFPMIGGSIGGKKVAGVIFLVLIFLLGGYLIIDFFFLKDHVSVTKYSNIKVVATKDVEEACGDKWYDPHAQEVLYRMFKINEENETEEETFRKTAEYFQLLMKKYACGLDTDAHKKVDAYNDLFQCLAEKGLINPNTMSSVNFFTGCSKDEYVDSTCTAEKSTQYVQEYCTENNCTSCIM